jgi:hypothetical protein
MDHRAGVGWAQGGLNIDLQRRDANQNPLVGVGVGVGVGIGVVADIHRDRLMQGLNELVKRLPRRQTSRQAAHFGPVAGQAAVNLNLERLRVHPSTP